MSDEIHDNIAVGSFAGHFLASNDNINIGNSGVAGESATIRISEIQTKTFYREQETKVFQCGQHGIFVSFASSACPPWRAKAFGRRMAKEATI